MGPPKVPPTPSEAKEIRRSAEIAALNVLPGIPSIISYLKLPPYHDNPFRTLSTVISIVSISNSPSIILVPFQRSSSVCANVRSSS